MRAIEVVRIQFIKADPGNAYPNPKRLESQMILWARLVQEII